MGRPFQVCYQKINKKPTNQTARGLFYQSLIAYLLKGIIGAMYPEVTAIAFCENVTSSACSAYASGCVLACNTPAVVIAPKTTKANPITSIGFFLFAFLGMA